jgi:hypothetical protein
MIDRRRSLFWARLGGGLALLLFAGIALWLLSSNYAAALALVIGGMAAWLVLSLLRRLIQRMGRRAVWLLVAIPVTVGGIAAALILFALPMGTAIAPQEVEGSGEPEEAPEIAPTEAVIRAYRVTVEPTDGTATFAVREEIVYDLTVNGEITNRDQLIQFAAREVEGNARGFLLREVEIEPLGQSVYADLRLPTPGGAYVDAPLCEPLACPPATVTLVDFPASSFYLARETTEVERVPYVQTETITWTTRTYERGLAFAYVPPPFHLMRPVIGPLLGASTASEWVAALVGALGGAVAIPLVKPLLVDIAEDKASEGIKRIKARRKKGTEPKKGA